MRSITASSVQIKVLQRRPEFLAGALDYQKQLQGKANAEGKSFEVTFGPYGGEDKKY